MSTTEARTYTREDMARILNNAGLTCSSVTHEPGNYDICDDCRKTCLDEVDAILRALPEMLARAWDEGYRARGADAIYTGLTGCPSDTPNPYEQEEA